MNRFNFRSNVIGINVFVPFITVLVVLAGLFSSPALAANPLVGQQSPTWPGMADMDGTMRTLEQHLGKDVIMLDFWSIYCVSCVQEMPSLVALYDKYKDQGFEIYGVSLDSDKNKWKAAIAKDQLTWNHVSDLKGWRSSAAQLYGVHSIPQTFLIDQEGRIIKAGLRSPQLEPLLKSLL